MQSLREILQTPLDSSVRTDSSILVVYPPEEEHEYRERLAKLLHFLKEQRASFRHIDLTTLPFEVIEARGLSPEIFSQEIEDASSVKRGLARAIREALIEKISNAAREVPGGSIILSGTSALYPVIKFADILTELRHLSCRIVLGFPGHEEGGKLYFMNQREGYNYLAVKLT